MKKGIVYSLFLGVLVLAGCSPKVTTTLIKAKAPLGPEEEISFLEREDTVTGDAVVLKTIQLAGRDYEPLLDIAKEEARTAGGEMVQMANHLTPDISSPRHRIAAVVLTSDESLLSEPGSRGISRRELESELNLQGRSSASWRIGVQGGVDYRIGRIPDNLEPVMEQHIRNTRVGYIYGADVTYFFTESIGLGLKFQNSYSADKMPASLTETDTGKVTNGYLENYENLWFAGPMFTYRVLSKNRKNAFFVRAGFGVAGYTNWGKQVKETLTYYQTAVSLGEILEVGYDLGIAKNLSLGACITLQNGGFNSFYESVNGDAPQRTSLEKGQVESLRYIGLTLGLRYNL